MLKHGLDFDVLTVLSATIDALAMAIAICWPQRAVAHDHHDGESVHVRRRVLGWQRLTGALFVGGVLFVVKLVPFAYLGVHAFGFIRLIYVDAVVVLPLIGLCILLRSMLRPRGVRPASGSMHALALIMLSAAGVGYYTTFYEPFNLQLETPVFEVSQSRKPAQPIRVGILADIQTNRVTEYERNALVRLMEQSPDLVLLPGDLFQGSADETEAQAVDLVKLLQLLNVPAGSFFVTGDVDHRPRIEPILRRAGVRLMDQQIERIRVGESEILLAGVSIQYRSPSSLETIRRFEAMDANGAIKILMAHRPGVVRHLSANSDIDLVVAGHTHGGQIVVPGFGPPITLSVLPRSVAKGGLHDVDGHAIYISRGVGCERGQSPRIRFNCPPEITLLTIQ